MNSSLQSLIVLSSLMMACVGSKGTDIGNTGGSSGLSDVKLALPELKDFPKSDGLDGYRVAITPVDASCASATKIDYAKSYADTTLSEKVRQGCDYLVVVELGHYNQGKQSGSLDAVYFTNAAKSGDGYSLTHDAIAGKASVAISLQVTVTEEGVRLGFGTRGETIGTDTDLDIKVTVKPTPTPSPTPTPTPDAPVELTADSITLGDATVTAAVSIKNPSSKDYSECRVWFVLEYTGTDDKPHGYNYPLGTIASNEVRQQEYTVALPSIYEAKRANRFLVKATCENTPVVTLLLLNSDSFRPTTSE